MPGRNMFTVLEETAARWPELPALYQPYYQGEARKYRVYCWREYREAAVEIAAGLYQLGIRRGDVVGLDAETRAEFYLADLGILANGSVAAALYTAYPPAERARMLHRSEARALFVDNPSTLRALKGVADPQTVAHWILLTGEAEGALTLDDLRRLGRQLLAREPDWIARTQAAVRPEDPAILYLTSGATGEPKMGLVSHAALVANADMGPEVLALGPQDSVLAFLPSAHITQRIVVELVPIRCGVPVWFAESLLKLPQELALVRPTFFVAPPRLWERVHATVLTEVRKRPWPLRLLFHAALRLGLASVARRQRGEPVSAWMRPLLKLADALVFCKIRARFGGRLKVCASGSAPLGRHLAEFYMAVGVPLVEGYGLTEGGILTLNPLGRPKAGSIGKCLPGVEVRLAEDGELCFRSPTLFSGYYKDSEATAAVLKDGWLATGDLGEIDGEGYVYITGRKKELIVNSSGRKIYPARIETLLKSEPVINQVLLVGDRRPYLTALVTINPAVAETLRVPAEQAVRKAIERVNRQVAPFEQIRRFRVLQRDFSIERGELTPTLKLRRSRALENFRAEIAELYAGREEC